ncbi:MAG: DUF1232 domain-containing protein [Anaerolineales bacterium]|nr:DUF1232 domain-containing protein [Anaerolineales bacterium]
MNLETALSTRQKEPGFWREVWQQIRLVYYLIKDPEVPFYLKLIPFVAVVYLLWPIDLITDVVPFLGQLDDLTALLVTSKVFVELVPQHVVMRHLDAIRMQDGYTAVSPDLSETNVDGELADAIVIDGEHEVIVEDHTEK